MDTLHHCLHNTISMTKNLTFMHCAHNPRCNAEVDKVFKGYAAIQFMQQGDLDLSYDDKHYALSGAWVWAAWPGPHTKFRATKGTSYWDHRYVAFHGEKVWDWVKNDLWPYKPIRAPQEDGDVRLFDEILRYAARSDPKGRELATAHLELFLRRLKDKPDARTATHQIVHEVRFRLNQFGTHPPDYKAIAADMKLAEITLRRRFLKATGKPIHSFFIEEKIAEARMLLTNSKLSIHEISDKLGYRDVFYFTRQFRKHVGTPPAAFRNSAQV